jgi:hypothetical protein
VETIQIDYSCVFVNLAIEYSLLSDAVDFFPHRELLISLWYS